MKIIWYKSSQVKSSQVVLSSCYFEILREACELVGSKYFDIKTKRLEDVCEILDYKRKPISKNKRIKGIYPYYGANGVQDYVNDYIFDGTYILMGEDGSVIDKNNNPILHWVDDKKIWVNNHAHVLKNLNNEINLKYVFYYLSTCDVSSIVKGTPPKINQGNLRKIRILIPPMNVQEYVVSILDKFDMLVNNINDGLPKEIELRQKQYEYYREKLLDFPRKEIS
ncbi:restriction endonuclease subunit S [Anaerococcus sp.]|uniref:restriction endonuclease subunit S n=1 Tax=Anaerococcus sp. TaxID=1872515 RepID=UPI002A91DC8A|nr:restriction endonuclease subunit S [Anaerococcus sp.]MDY6126710.1 restriction endonuclease subunit S [Anaerococcus sp.]